MYIKAFTVLFILAFTVDATAFDGAYRRGFAHGCHKVAANVTRLHWTGFVGR